MMKPKISLGVRLGHQGMHGEQSGFALQLALSPYLRLCLCYPCLDDKLVCELLRLNKNATSSHACTVHKSP